MKPERIQKAIFGVNNNEDNADYLSAAGSKGAEVANKNREREKIENEILTELAEEAAALDAHRLRESTNENTVPINPEDIDERD